MLGTRQGNIDSVLSLQEPNLALSIASDKGQEDDLVLLTLEVVHDSDANTITLRIVGLDEL
jgi:hypothetical protein